MAKRIQRDIFTRILAREEGTRVERGSGLSANVGEHMGRITFQSLPIGAYFVWLSDMRAAQPITQLKTARWKAMSVAYTTPDGDDMPVEPVTRVVAGRADGLVQWVVPPRLPPARHMSDSD
jgi:hypothetical protein